MNITAIQMGLLRIRQRLSHDMFGCTTVNIALCEHPLAILASVFETLTGPTKNSLALGTVATCSYIHRLHSYLYKQQLHFPSEHKAHNKAVNSCVKFFLDLHQLQISAWCTIQLTTTSQYVTNFYAYSHQHPTEQRSDLIKIPFYIQMFARIYSI